MTHSVRSLQIVSSDEGEQLNTRYKNMMKPKSNAKLRTKHYKTIVLHCSLTVGEYLRRPPSVLLQSLLAG